MDAETADKEPADHEIPRLLIARRWQQGSVFRAVGAQLWCLEAEAGMAAGQLTARPRPTPSDGRFVVVSQTCDIAAAIAKEPVVTALACAIEPDPVQRALYTTSFRWFEIDRTTGLIAHAMYSLLFDKRTLLTIEPEDWPDTQERLSRFSIWLARRAFRSAIPTPIVNGFVKPLKSVLDRLQVRDPATYESFLRAVGEIRIGLPSTEAPPFEINLVLLQEHPTLTAEEDDAVGLVERTLRTKLKPEVASLGEVLRTTKSRMSVEFYFERSVLVDFDALTFEGDEIVGALPLPPP